MKSLKARRFAAILLVPLFFFTSTTIQAATAVIMAASTRTAEDGKPIRVPAVLTGPDDPDFLLIEMPPGNGAQLLKREGNRLLIGYQKEPWLRIRGVIAGAGIGLMTLGAPSDHPKGVDHDWRLDPRHVEDLRPILRYAHQKFPKARIYVVGFGEALTSVLSLARANPSETEGYIVIGGTWSLSQKEGYSEKKRFLVLHAANHQCPPADLYDAREASLKNGLTLVEAGYSDTEPKATCSALSHNGLAGLEREFGKVIVDWLKGQPIPMRIGDLSKENDLREEVHYFGSTDAEGKTHRLQMTLFLPKGKGPFPLVVFNHGDVKPENKLRTEHIRYNPYAVYHAFLSTGVAVALPERAGVGKSEGEYYLSTGGELYRDALVNSRINAYDILSAVAYLRSLPSLDPDNIVLSGTSAGGMTSLYIASRSPAWLRGVVSFAGGITDVPNPDISHLPTSLNRTMVNAFKTMGFTSRVPTLWLFTENDTHYSVKTIKASHEGYTNAGGVATLKLFPPIEGEDGHFLAEKHPEMWTEEVRAFLGKLGPPWPNKGPSPQ